MIPDPDAEKPEDWDEEMDGDWEAPLIDNPECKAAPGCGTWKVHWSSLHFVIRTFSHSFVLLPVDTTHALFFTRHNTKMLQADRVFTAAKRLVLGYCGSSRGMMRMIPFAF